MNKLQNLGAQLFLLVGHGVNLNTFPQKLQMYAGLLIALIQAYVSWRAHHVNPDGTPATARYDPAPRA